MLQADDYRNERPRDQYRTKGDIVYVGRQLVELYLGSDGSKGEGPEARPMQCDGWGSPLSMSQIDDIPRSTTLSTLGS